MSYTEIIKVPESGQAEVVAEIRNSWRGAYYVWNTLWKKYLPGEFPLHELRPLWDLDKRTDVPEDERIVLVSTFDNVMVKRDGLPRVISAFENFAQQHPHCSLGDQAQVLRELSTDKDCYAVCWNQTSVNADTWRVVEGDGDSVRMYDLSKDHGHWFMFQEDIE